ncbi:ribosomal-protein-alanine N-acetyltransferase [Octadecabacter temperatus]|uniref:Ribosomal-protein-alanine N-acetyltransferase n=1 Tax=Octadecabacter temperatus TaxID=1458307 RepID=A0A0K0Y2D8_9RHOB|nr:GNAT family N-acetyltransferase [Octadecabacter temperatus]AKS45067.1 ribosomal-protein-alanine N-acetyltransferase [Octadecabacter temperatus]SIN85555.1 ribosomal-protein-alanine N-acetyltransferase [Octadecabacter temperatus]
MTPEGLAFTHAAAFGGNGWPEADFAQYLDDPNVFLHGTDLSFVVLRRAGPEAEVLTLASDPSCQGNGLATRNLERALRILAHQGVQDIFLEVAEDNIPALAIYTRCGFTEISRRPKYYKNGATAICMKIELSVASFPDTAT